MFNRGQTKAANVNSSTNEMKAKLSGIVIEDSFNNIMFPVENIKIDNGNFQYHDFLDIFKLKYGDSDILPWHFVVEFVNEEYIIFTTRPINFRYQFTTKQINEHVIENNVKIINNETKTYLSMNVDMSTMAHVLILGDSTRDVYIDLLYKKLITFIINPLSKRNAFVPSIGVGIFPLNMGKRFRYDKI